MRSLRIVTYLAPSLPLELFKLVVRHLEKELEIPSSLRVETSTSGPLPHLPNPFSSGEVDLGFVCSPSYIWLTTNVPAAVDLLPAAPVFLDPRARGRPVYFSDVIVPRASRVHSWVELKGGTWAYNDTCSLSGYYSMRQKLADLGDAGGFFRQVRHTGSHLESIRLVAAGEVDGAAIDSNVLALRLRHDPQLQLRIRILDSWGPFPIQPIVARSGLARSLREEITAALLAMDKRPNMRNALRKFGMKCFVKVSEDFYATEREALERVKDLSWTSVAAE